MRTLIIFALALCAAPTSAQPEAPQQIARQMDVTSQIKGDLQSFSREFNGAATMEKSVFNGYDYVYGARPGIYGASEWARGVKSSFDRANLIVDRVEVQKQFGDEAQALIAFHFEFPDGKQDVDSIARELPREEQVQLKLGTPTFNPQARIWQIVPPTEPPSALIKVVASPRSIDLNFWANAAYYLSQRHPSPPLQSSADLSIYNLKRLGLGVIQLVQDYDQVYAFDPRYQVEAIKPYLGDSKFFQVPDTNEIYAFNANLSGLNMANNKVPARTVLFYEGQNEKPIYRYDGKAAICFADGHAALVSPEEAQKLIWKP